ncbi:hypothetical protein B0H17DRAFT_101376 [Mycena rosella]|uniref:Uncharacterized protein n=1 Tax=Mycena rosella TaxID=1033263 RepID=A0AAD7F5T1_MYCRO|nr:hypothetical protein B0H17DRAFT_101376 [Mycena rosella]
MRFELGTEPGPRIELARGVLRSAPVDRATDARVRSSYGGSGLGRCPSCVPAEWHRDAGGSSPVITRLCVLRPHIADHLQPRTRRTASPRCAGAAPGKRVRARAPGCASCSRIDTDADRHRHKRKCANPPHRNDPPIRRDRPRSVLASLARSRRLCGTPRGSAARGVAASCPSAAHRARRPVSHDGRGRCEDDVQGEGPGFPVARTMWRMAGTRGARSLKSRVS